MDHHSAIFAAAHMRHVANVPHHDSTSFRQYPKIHMSRIADISGHKVQIVTYSEPQMVTLFTVWHCLQWSAIVDTVTAWRQTDGDT
jgi:hypothetical protein